MDAKKLHLGIEAGEVLLKVALYDPTERKVVKTDILDTGTNPLVDIASFEHTLHDWISKEGVEQLGSVGLTVSSFRAIVRQLFVPPEATDVREYLEWYLGTLINAEVDDYVLDFVELAGSAELGRTVLMIAMRKAWVNAVRKGFRDQNVAPQILEVDVLSLMNLLEAGAKLGKKTVCVLKADVTGVMILWATKDNLRALRSCSTLELAGKESEEAYALLSKNIAGQIQAVADDLKISTDKVLICGELATDSRLVEELQKALGEDISLSPMDSFAEIRLPTDDESASHVLSCAGAIGVALRSAKHD